MRLWPNARLSFTLILGFLTLALSPGWAAVSASKTLPDGAQFTVDGGTLRIQFWSENIVRVTFAPSAALPPLTSVSVVATPATVRWTRRDNSQAFTLATSRLKASIDKQTGAVTFFDPANHVLLREAAQVARGVVRTDRSTWVPGPVPGLSPRMKRKATFQLLWTEVVTSAVDQLLNGDWDLPTHCGSVLVTFPDSTHWECPRGIWHADTHFAHRPKPLFGVKTYGFLNAVVAGQGGTCVISGSHHLVEEFARTNPQIVQALGHLPGFMKSHPWLVDLRQGPDQPDRTSRLMTPTEINGHEVQVVELTGEPGDVVLTHPWTLHCIAPNAGDRPRMMTSKNIWRRGVEQVLPAPVDLRSDD